jgi:hypothetical protein
MKSVQFQNKGIKEEIKIKRPGKKINTLTRSVVA